MRNNQSILFKTLIFLLFFTSVYSLKANWNIVYIGGKSHNQQLCLKIYEKLKEFVGKENIDYPMQINQQQTRHRSNTEAKAFEARDHHWNILSKKIETKLNENKVFQLVIFGNAKNLLRKTIEEFKNENKLNLLNTYLYKIIYLIPPKNILVDLEIEKLNLNDVVNNLDLLSQDLIEKKESLKQSPSSPIIKISDEAEEFINSKIAKQIEINEIITDITRWQRAILKISKNYDKFIAEKVANSIIETIESI